MLISLELVAQFQWGFLQNLLVVIYSKVTIGFVVEPFINLIVRINILVARQNLVTKETCLVTSETGLVTGEPGLVNREPGLVTGGWTRLVSTGKDR